MIFKNVSIDFSKCGLYILFGKSGVGKSTLLNIIAGLDRDYIGQVECDYSISYSRQTISLIDNLTLKENISLMQKHIDLKILRLFGIVELLNMKVYNMSGGQKVRCELFNSYISGKKVILIDEPTASLDDKNGMLMIEIIKYLSQSKIVIVASHDNRLKTEANYLIELVNQEVKITSNLYSNKLLDTESKIKCKNISVFKIYKLLFKADIWNYIAQYIVLFILMIMFVLISASFSRDLVNDYHSLVGNYSENSIRINLDGDTKIRLLDSYPNVFDFGLVYRDASVFKDLNGQELNIDSTKYSFKFTPLLAPINMNKYYNKFNIEVVGKYPVNNTNQILIPSDLCIELKVNCDEILNTNITLLTSINNTKYYVSGYYDSTKDTSDVGFIYTPYDLNLLDINQLIDYTTSIFIIPKNKNTDMIEVINDTCDTCIIETNKIIRTKNKNQFRNLVSTFVISLLVLLIVYFGVVYILFKNFNTRRQIAKIKLKLMHISKVKIIIVIILENLVMLITPFISLLLVLHFLNLNLHIGELLTSTVLVLYLVFNIIIDLIKYFPFKM